ncbi:hypothetical protein T01_6486 [Trichinella spiralis]|uniref:Uncharacterized protein n=1 Tax=Trichinella spiralis TaxID=6334 RepID=A0A0V1ANQ9_TRISP|nr:hypothetical protein T01_6486 [Trichinella spiralis]
MFEIFEHGEVVGKIVSTFIFPFDHRVIIGSHLIGCCEIVITLFHEGYLTFNVTSECDAANSSFAWLLRAFCISSSSGLIKERSRRIMEFEQFDRFTPRRNVIQCTRDKQTNKCNQIS